MARAAGVVVLLGAPREPVVLRELSALLLRDLLAEEATVRRVAAFARQKTPLKVGHIAVVPAASVVPAGNFLLHTADL